MNHDDNDDREQTSGPEGEQQLGFDEAAFDKNPRRLEPVFEDSETLKSFEEDLEDDASEDTFEDSLYSSEYDEDAIDRVLSQMPVLSLPVTGWLFSIL